MHVGPTNGECYHAASARGPSFLTDHNGGGFGRRPFSASDMIDTAKAKQLRDQSVRLARSECRTGYNSETKGLLRRLTKADRKKDR
jgi:hypothetical protein